MGFANTYFEYETKIIAWLGTLPYVHQFIHDPISGRITFFLIVVGTMAFINELYITIEMSFLQKETYEELEKGHIDESLKLHRMIVQDDFHSKEYMDDKSGIIIEEFEEREKFFAKPVHVAHVYVICDVLQNNENVLTKPFKFHLEFSPEEFENEKRQEFGCNLRVLRTKLYHLFKDTELYHELNEGNKYDFTVSQSINIYNTVDDLLPTSIDDIQLCFLKIQTGDQIKCEFLLEN
ncbi:hypothetical protein Kpol_1041p24 [Vanderwaltozyma polyspora DSM 70294]|uniref:Uncharacterized protein n=1 Tax=Vanderwaltozyma polyspora (strain ATCC 22028 / DSM 70294 / BCRC 21397 / CBS 2163 / NBRC 10782 / NRRL Y-8283 / UCD 57-17) TaxID=436907 RepID=A7TL91_VANPO|nr:uncharacterized protein Kpol_1041p24 [Vanderwaltozyma polyspora DSM 70294]EDO16966.1 hypothetical protein Kpol_1041p24 [Vanderwaltozyma polyspora DSM 70294]